MLIRSHFPLPLCVFQLVASSGPISISGWFVLGRWTFLRQKDQKWLGEVISETLDRLAELGIVREHRFAMQWCNQRLAPIHQTKERRNDYRRSSRMAEHSRMPSTSSEDPSSDSYKNRHDILDARSPRVRFQGAVRAVIELQRTTSKQARPIRPGLPRRDSWWQTSTSSGFETPASPTPDPGICASRGARVAKVVEELKALELAQEIFPYAALVQHIQFSPNGRCLATSRLVYSYLHCVPRGCRLTSLPIRSPISDMRARVPGLALKIQVMVVYPMGVGVYKADSVKDVAESLGIANLPDAVASALASDAEYRIHQVIEEAARYMRHARRTVLTTTNIDLALRTLNMEPLHGHTPHALSTFQRTLPFPHLASAGPVYFVEDEEIDFDKILREEKITVPRGINWTAYWLAVEGVQPLVPENSQAVPREEPTHAGAESKPPQPGVAVSAPGRQLPQATPQINKTSL
ncbi:TATA box binding protein associated factor-domain-containing protein [Boletus reticuloceps]|uniref:TBP-associated factor 6 n=1 Tax=Boletus reticuloceps TaxID=495285 RepID=A0A8I2YFK6_9AGAM|nr:TATA box binding protein associated factor-domain-containing protein [Boletus reticuloceps]